MDNFRPKPAPTYRPGSWLTRLEGYLLIPHELLHVAGYRLVGKHCHYRWGDTYVTPIGPMTRNEKLAGLLFPLVACLLTWVILFPFPFVALFIVDLTWVIILAAIPALPLGYAFTTIGDLRQAYLLLHDAPPHQKTSFDFFFWPLLTDPRRVQTLTFIVLVSALIIYATYLIFF